MRLAMFLLGVLAGAVATSVVLMSHAEPHCMIDQISRHTQVMTLPRMVFYDQQPRLEYRTTRLVWYSQRINCSGTSFLRVAREPVLFEREKGIKP